MTQATFDWSAPEIRSNPSLRDATQERRQTLQKAAWRCLERLVEGPARGHELEALGGRRFGARLGEIRSFLRQQLGMPEWADPDDCNPIPYPGSGADPEYVLMSWAMAAAREALARRRA